MLWKTFYGVSKYQRGPVGAHLVKRMTYDAETDELLASDDIKDLMGRSLWSVNFQKESTTFEPISTWKTYTSRARSGPGARSSS